MPQLNAYGIMNVEKKTVVNCVYEADKHVAKGSDIEIEFMAGQKVVSKINELRLSFPQFAGSVLNIVIDAGNVKYINSDLIKYHSQEESTEETTTEETTSVIVPEETSTDEETSSMNNSESITEKEVDEKASEKTTKHSDKKVKTGDEAPIIIWAIVIVIC